MAIDYSNYLIAHHLNWRYYVLPMYPEQVEDSLNSTFRSTEILARSAPIQSWSGAGPRSLSISLVLHRDLDWSPMSDGIGPKDGLKVGNINELIDEYQSLTLPNYSTPMKVEPPLVTLRIGKALRVTGVPKSVSFTHMLPIDENGVYQRGIFSITIEETKPYDAVSVASSLHNARGESLTSSNSVYSAEDLFIGNRLRAR